MGKRTSFAVVIASLSGLWTAIGFHLKPGPSDFAPVWYGAWSLLHRVNPYTTFGPGLDFHYEWHLYYPATAMVAMLPFGLLSEPHAAVLFSSVSAGLLAFAITRDNWDRCWIFLSASFLTAMRTAQWSPIMAAAVLMPALGFLTVCKPNLGAAVIASTPSMKSLRIALVAGVVLTAISLILLPTWPVDWWRSVVTGQELNAPITRPAGFLIALALLRWRQPEARLLLAMSCVPQTSSWYETLIPLLVARTKREMQVLGLASGLGYVMQIVLLTNTQEIATTDVGVLMVVFVYLPALAVVLRRPNRGVPPAWMQVFKTPIKILS